MMARAKLKPSRDSSEIGRAIVAAWFKVLGKSESAERLLGDAERDELTAVFSEILDSPFVVEIDPDPSTNAQIKIVVPQPPRNPEDPSAPNVTTRQQLIEYLARYHQYGQGRQYHEDLGIALIFGCGK